MYNFLPPDLFDIVAWAERIAESYSILLFVFLFFASPCAKGYETSPRLYFNASFISMAYEMDDDDDDDEIDTDIGDEDYEV